MKGLSKEQKSYLKKHVVELYQVYDAYGQPNRVYKPIMKELGKVVAYNVTPCKNGSHTLRNRSGHCIQCNSAYLAFQNRSDSPGVEYVAKTEKGHVIKIGFSKSVETRSESLNRTEYGGVNDWKIVGAIKSSKAGQIEHQVNLALAYYSKGLIYDHDGHKQETFETFDCDLELAFAELNRIGKMFDKNCTLL